MRLSPMPSPNGTNHERLFILRGRKPRGFAYDARPDEPGMTASNFHGPEPWSQNMATPDGGGMEAIKAFLRQKLQPNDFAQLEKMIQSRAGAQDDGPETDAVGQLLEWCSQNMDPADCNRLAARLRGSSPAEDNEIGGPAASPVDWQPGKTAAAELAGDSRRHGVASLLKEFPDLARIGHA
jgi:hypothetical protein